MEMKGSEIFSNKKAIIYAFAIGFVNNFFIAPMSLVGGFIINLFAFGLLIRGIAGVVKERINKNKK